MIHRRRTWFVHLCLLAVALGFCSTILWTPGRFAYDPANFNATHTFGAMPWLELHRERLPSSAVVPAYAFRWVIDRRAMMILAAISAVVMAASWVAARWLVRDLRLRSRCDSCGYDLTGIESARCPECGQARDPQRLDAPVPDSRSPALLWAALALAGVSGLGKVFADILEMVRDIDRIKALAASPAMALSIPLWPIELTTWMYSGLSVSIVLFVMWLEIRRRAMKISR